MSRLEVPEAPWYHPDIDRRRWVSSRVVRKIMQHLNNCHKAKQVQPMGCSKDSCSIEQPTHVHRTLLLSGKKLKMPHGFSVNSGG